MEDFDTDTQNFDGLFDVDELDSGVSVRTTRPSEPPELLTYVAHYTSPTNANPVKGFFEFESIHRASSKLNRHDARVRMLEIYGEEAVSWVIDEVKIKRKTARVCSEQLELDFREPKKPRKRVKPKKYL